MNIDHQFKENIKQALMAQLITENLVVRRQVSAAIAQIARIEIPRKEWLELLANLSGNASND